MKIKKLVEIKHMEVKRESIISYYYILELCARPYPNHPNGCINKEKCQIRSFPLFDDIDIFYEFEYYYVVYLIFDFKQYKELKRIDWKERGIKITEGGIRNSRHWQNSLKSLLRKEIEVIHKNNKEWFYILGSGGISKLSFQKRVASMEALGINVFSTMRLNGVKLEVKPKDKIILCNLLCSKKPLRFNNKKQMTLTELIRNES